MLECSIHSMETDLANGFKYISHISNLLKDKFTETVTKEELMNYYLHDMKAKGSMDLNVTTVNLVQAANLANIRVKGQSKLEVNVPIMEQMRYIMEDIKARGKSKSIKEKLNNNKDSIVKAYECGESIKSLAKAWGCSDTVMRRYLIEFGVTMRKAGVKKLNIVNNSSSRKKKRRRKCYA